MKNKRNWSDNDKHWGPFTFSKSNHGWGITLDSGEGEHPGCHLIFHAFRCTLILELPQIVRPFRTKVHATYWDPETIKRMGRDWFWTEDARVFGITVLDGHFTVHLGRSTMDSETDRRWSCFLPWTQWRFIRFSLYDRSGNHFWTESDRKDWKARHAAEKACPSVVFGIVDFDGELIKATTKIEEREWRFGEPPFRWLSLFRKPRVRRSLDIAFSEETGRKKGSWKGGTLGHGIEMLPGELHEQAFRRYCLKHEMTFMGELTESDHGVMRV